MEDDITRQADEIESLSSIYDENWRVESETGQSYSVKITDSVVLYITLPINYPSQSPPVYQLSAPELKHEEKQEISRILEETYLENIGETVIFQWAEAIRTYVTNKNELLERLASEISLEHDIEDNLQVGNSVWKNDDECNMTVEKELEIHHGEIIVDRRSTFQGHVVAVSTVVEVKCALKQLLRNKKIENATHNIYAYRIKKDEKCMIQDCEDDGETHAGKRLLQLLQMMELTNVLVVVSRWYGGIHLGPDRFRHINNAARDVLTTSGFAKKK